MRHAVALGTGAGMSKRFAFARGVGWCTQGHANDFQNRFVGLLYPLPGLDSGGGEMDFVIQREKSRRLDGETQGAAVGEEF